VLEISNSLQAKQLMMSGHVSGAFMPYAEAREFMPLQMTGCNFEKGQFPVVLRVKLYQTKNETAVYYAFVYTAHASSDPDKDMFYLTQ